ncbi:MAG: flagellin, partial [Oscillospiraceae bacterium]
NIGTNAGDQASLAAPTGADRKVGNDTYRDFVINKGKADVKETLNVGLHVGADADMNNKITIGIDAMDSSSLGIKGLNVKDSTGSAATYAIDAIADAVAKVSAQRSALGAVQNRLEHTINNLDNVVENTTSAESQIRDTDMADEMVKYSKNNILQQAGQSMLAQANQSNQGVLSLLG